MFKLGTPMVSHSGNIVGIVDKADTESFHIRYWFRGDRLIHFGITYWKHDPESYDHWMTVEDYVTTG